MRLNIESTKTSFYDDKGKRLKEKPWKTEKELEYYLFDHPQTILGKNGQLIGRQVAWADIVGIDKKGRLMVVEIKRHGVPNSAVRQIAKHLKRLNMAPHNLLKFLKEEQKRNPKKYPIDLDRVARKWNLRGRKLAVIACTRIQPKVLRNFGQLQKVLRAQGYECILVLVNRLLVKGHMIVTVNIMAGKK